LIKSLLNEIIRVLLNRCSFEKTQSMVLLN
jgi:hypothetical protein